MKKLKFLPSVLMMIMCIAVLCVGIYAASPTSNTVKGSITVTSMARIKITGYINDEEYFAARNTSAGVEWDLTKSDLLKFDAFNAADETEVPQKIIRLRIQNLSTMTLGAYFYSGTGLVKDGDTEYASYESLQHSQEIYPVGMADGDKNADTKLADVTLSTYTYLAPKSEDTDYDEIDMYITIDVANLFYEEYEGEFEFNLRVEAYKEGSLGTAKKLTKLANPTQADQDTTDVYSIPDQTDTNIGVLVVPTTYTKVTATSISGLTGLEHLILPTSITTMADGCLASCWSLKSLSVPCCGKNISVAPTSPGPGQEYNPINAFFSGTAPTGDVEYITQNIGGNYFYIPTSLKTVYLNAPIIKHGTIYGNNDWELNTLIIGQNVRRIETDPPFASMIRGGVGISCLLVPKCVEYISQVGCYGLKNLIIGARHIDDYIYVPTSVKHVVFLDSVTTLENEVYAFNGCTFDVVTINSAAVLTSAEFCYNDYNGSQGALLDKAKIVKVLSSIIESGGTNAALNNENLFTRSETAIDGYYVFTKVGA